MGIVGEVWRVLVEGMGITREGGCRAGEEGVERACLIARGSCLLPSYVIFMILHLALCVCVCVCVFMCVCLCVCALHLLGSWPSAVTSSTGLCLPI